MHKSARDYVLDCAAKVLLPQEHDDRVQQRRRFSSPETGSSVEHGVSCSRIWRDVVNATSRR
jgi:hypothetical protein